MLYELRFQISALEKHFQDVARVFYHSYIMFFKGHLALIDFVGKDDFLLKLLCAQED